MQSFPRLLGDVGGTNVRFALETAPQRIGPATALKVADFPSLEAAMQHYLGGLPAGIARPRHAAVGLANPVTGDRVKLTNHAWAFSISQMQRSLGLDLLLAINDFTALALGLPHLGAQDLTPLRQGVAVAGAPLALVGPGTGLGVSGLVPARSGPAVALAGEGGHIELMPETEDEWTAWRAARQAFGRVSAERLLSGMGLSLTHAALHAETGTPLARQLEPAEVTEGAIHRHDPLCERALAVFCGLLGSVAADIALVLGARGGVYLGGGIVPRFVPALRNSAFNARFTAKGRMSAYLESLPVYVINAQYPALPGLAQALDEAITHGADGDSDSDSASRANPANQPNPA
ncbi:glucokinase [Cupriavidus basilensis]|uniref:glucokinase n=1 Tax=Cupriavidus basilensis TaxID=68895 RepID=UPI002843704B|nr:glucokinase [Cupriavidus basilensis]MDR3380486.1 glucokinase [Cupriavidus basilensis]